MKRYLDRFAASTCLVTALPVLLGCFLCVLNLREVSVLTYFVSHLEVHNSRSFLLAGLPGERMITLPLFGTLLSAALNLGLTPLLLYLISHLFIYALAFSAGCLLRGYWAGILSLAGTGLLEAYGLPGRSYNPEQSFFGLCLLLVLALLLLRRREDGLVNDVLVGLALGASMLVRSPLFLFPPILTLCNWLSGERSRAYLLRSLVFLAASYALLIPWSVLGHSITGRFDLFDAGRAEDNVVTGAMGSIYTGEGDTRKMAGLDAGESPSSLYIRRMVQAPLSFLQTVVKRLWHISLFYPLLSASFLLALLLSRDKGRRLIFSLPVYFVAIHALLPIESNYFYPLLYLVPPIVAGTLLPRGWAAAPDCCLFARRAVKVVFALVLCSALGVNALIMAYPARAARNSTDEAFFRVTARFPNDLALQESNCSRLLARADTSVFAGRGGDHSGYYKCRRDFEIKFKTDPGQHFWPLMMSRSPSKIPIVAQKDRELKTLLIARMLREFELGDETAAMKSFARAYAMYDARWNTLRGTPYDRDRQIAALLKRDSGRFWNIHVSGIIRLWPLERRVKILSRLERNFKLPISFKKRTASLDFS